MKQKELNSARMIELLADGAFHSGNDIGQHLGVSRTAISKYVAALESLGLDIFKVTGKGYRLAEPLQLLDATKISEYLVETLGERALDFEIHRVVGSSNDEIKQRVKTSLVPGFAIFAEAQTAGRGRRGKQWQSPFGCNLYLSLYYPLKRGLSAVMGLSLAIGVGIAELLHQQGILGVELKWPNDILVDGKKLCGILIELDGQANGDAHAIIGIGLNIAMPGSVENAIDQPWTDLRRAAERPIDRNFWAAALLACVRKQFSIFEVQGLTPFIPTWLHYDRFALQPVRLLLGHEVIEGIVEGIDEQGALLLRRGNVIEKYHAGEVSLRHGV